MKILYVGPLADWGICLSRLNALKKIHGSVEAYNSAFVGQQGLTLYRFAESQLCFGHSFVRANGELLKRAEEKSADLIWIDNGFWIWPRTLRALKRKGAFLVHYYADDINAKHVRWSSRLLRSSLKYYDLHFVSNTFNKPEMERMEAKKVLLAPHGYDKARFLNGGSNKQELKQRSIAVSFVGHWEPNTEEGISALFRSNIPVKVYGWGWQRAQNKKLLSSGRVESRYLYGEDYVRCLREAKICLGFLSKWNRNLSTDRIYEIPACGSFLLAERTKITQRDFKEGREAEFFSSQKELVEKVRYYLEHDTEREEIAREGQARCIRSPYSWEDHVRVILEEIKDEMKKKRSKDRG